MTWLIWELKQQCRMIFSEEERSYGEVEKKLSLRDFSFDCSGRRKNSLGPRKKKAKILTEN